MCGGIHGRQVHRTWRRRKEELVRESGCPERDRMAANACRGEGGRNWMARTSRSGLAVELDVSASTFPLDTFCCTFGACEGRRRHGGQRVRTTRVRTVARKAGCHTLITSLLGGRCAGGRGKALASGRGGGGWGLFRGMALVDMSRKEVAGERAMEVSTGSAAVDDVRNGDVPSSKLIPTMLALVWAITSV